MGPFRIEVTSLPGAPLDAAAEFFARWLPEIRRSAEADPERDFAIQFFPASHEHRCWRLAAIQELARELAPRRVNGIVGDEEGAITDTIAFLHGAPGITGQLLPVGSKG